MRRSERGGGPINWPPAYAWIAQRANDMHPWIGKLLGILAGAALLRGQPLLGAAIGALIGHAIDRGWFERRRDNPYAALGLTRSASNAEIDQAYRRLIRQHHPDKFAGAPAQRRQQAEHEARELNAAYDRIRTLRKR